MAKTLQTVPEQTDYKSTSHLKDVISFFSELQARYPNQVVLSSIGTTFEGRRIPLVILGNPVVTVPGQSKKPVILFVANIHAGEVEGKEALQMLARDMLKNRHPALKRFTVLMVPVFNPDGNEKISPLHRVYQQIKNGVGVRTNGLNMDLNRDFVKLESPEDRALVRLFDRWLPLVYVDCHTTDGSHHTEPLTWIWGRSANGSEAVHRYIYAILRPWLNRYAWKNYKIAAIPYGNFDDAAHPKKWVQFPSVLMVGVDYFGVKGAFSFLDENYAYADFSTRIRACYAFLDSLLHFTLSHQDEMTALVRRFRNRPGVEFHYNVKAKAFPEKVIIHGFREYRNKNGRRVVTAERVDKRLDFMGDFSGDVKKFSGAYVFPAGMNGLKEKLRQHGIQVYTVLSPFTANCRIYHFSKITYKTRPFQGHVMMDTVEGKWRSSEKTIPAGWYAVPLNRSQLFRQLAVAVLEPESRDALYRYGFWSTMIYPSEWRDVPGDYPVYRIEKSGGMKIRLLNNAE
ncbi:MAG: M14 family metallopeptidase [Acidobacteria bacterium]|nr:M14 family metallopeptidase [Acidobacteriota bacterium]